MAKTFYELVASADITSAFKMLPASDEKTLLLSRWNKNEKDDGLGLLDKRDYDKERNRVVNALISLGTEAGLCPKDTTAKPETPQNRSDGAIDENLLVNAIRENWRRRPDFTERIKKFMEEYAAYKLKTQTEPTFDVAKRRLAIFKDAYKTILAELGAKKEDDLVSFVEKIDTLLSDLLPSYKKLEEAYKLVCGRGFVDEWVERQLKNKPADNDTIIEIADRIQAFAAKVNQK